MCVNVRRAHTYDCCDFQCLYSMHSMGPAVFAVKCLQQNRWPHGKTQGTVNPDGCPLRQNAMHELPAAAKRDALAPANTYRREAFLTRPLLAFRGRAARGLEKRSTLMYPVNPSQKALSVHLCVLQLWAREEDARELLLSLTDVNLGRLRGCPSSAHEAPVHARMNGEVECRSTSPQAVRSELIWRQSRQDYERTPPLPKNGRRVWPQRSYVACSLLQPRQKDDCNWILHRNVFRESVALAGLGLGENQYRGLATAPYVAALQRQHFSCAQEAMECDVRQSSKLRNSLLDCKSAYVEESRNGQRWNLR